jgi:geranylgeranyl pyrophosphate synthase
MTMLTQTPYKVRFEKHLQAIQTFLEEILVVQEPEPLWQAMRHGVLNGGKRIRPVLLTETCLANGGTFENALGTAGALELIHCYSLIHDDLPCMDNDDLRRGQPTVHKAFSEDLAVLAGDALVGMAFGLIVDKTHGVPDKTLLRVISELSLAASVRGLVNGQVDDTLSAQAQPSEALLYRIHKGKTAALFRFSTWAGGMLAGQSQEVVDLLGQYGEHLGIAFQIVDDLLDVESSSETLGKTPGKDAAQGKITFPAVYGIEGSRKVLKEYIVQLNGILDRLAPHMETQNLRYLVQFVEERKS